MKKSLTFLVTNPNTKEKIEVKYLTQQELAEGFKQIIPNYNKKRVINHFNITLAYLPEYLWCKLKKEKTNGEYYYKSIKDGMTIYDITETNLDDIMLQLYKEIKLVKPDKIKIKNLIDELDDSLHHGWLVLRAKNYLKNGYFY